jgi:hypothetical protein
MTDDGAIGDGERGLLRTMKSSSDPNEMLDSVTSEDEEELEVSVMSQTISSLEHVSSSESRRGGKDTSESMSNDEANDEAVDVGEPEPETMPAMEAVS